MDIKSIGRKIKEKRKLKRWRQDDLAERTELSIDYIGKIERGERLPKLKIFVRILNELGASADDILSEVLDYGYITRSSIYSEKIGKLPKEEQEKIFSVIEALLEKK